MVVVFQVTVLQDGSLVMKFLLRRCFANKLLREGSAVNPAVPETPPRVILTCFCDSGPSRTTASSTAAAPLCCLQCRLDGAKAQSFTACCVSIFQGKMRTKHGKYVTEKSCVNNLLCWIYEGSKMSPALMENCKCWRKITNRHWSQIGSTPLGCFEKKLYVTGMVKCILGEFDSPHHINQQSGSPRGITNVLLFSTHSMLSCLPVINLHFKHSILIKQKRKRENLAESSQSLLQMKSNQWNKQVKQGLVEFLTLSPVRPGLDDSRDHCVPIPASFMPSFPLHTCKNTQFWCFKTNKF